MHLSDLVVLTPPGLVDPSVAIAACRAGARGILDLEFAQDLSLALTALKRLEQFTNTSFGVKIGLQGDFLVNHLATQPVSRLAWVILAGGDHPQLIGWVDFFRQRQIEVLLEVTCLAEGARGEQLGVAGLIMKGQEAGGRVGGETAFILLQHWLQQRSATGLPFWVQGGIGLHTAAACSLAGARGVVLDSQVLLARESPMDEATRLRLASFDGSETACLGERLGQNYRFYSRPGCAAADQLMQEEERLVLSQQTPAERLEAWQQTVHRLVGRGVPVRDLWLLGQDVVLAKPLADRFVTVGGILQGLMQEVPRHLAGSRKLQPLAAGSPLAKKHGTRYPILQGPMTRVSDTAAFAKAVAQGGGLPFLALALLRGAEVEKLLDETRKLVGNQPWGVGLLGFAPPEIRTEQLEALRKYKPPFALIAGGRPDQARELDKDGMATYLHVPSPGLLRMFLKDGARRFIFEGRECGGHVGPRSSFVLWETMCAALLEHLHSGGKGEELSIIFAGGIHDALSCAMVSTLAAPLAEKGVALGILMGTAYLFTQEAVEGGAIVPRFQQEALHCTDTVLLETGPGHAVRCLPTPFFNIFEEEKQKLRKEGRSHDEVRLALEWMNIGRLRIAAKGVDRAPAGSTGPKMVTLDEEDQFARGLYMIGQVASLRDRVVSVAQLHEEVCGGGQRLLEKTATLPAEIKETPEKPCDIAIIGMSCFYPKAGNLRAYWENILNRVNAVTEIPPTHWDWRLFYDPNPRARDKIISKWGGFLEDIAFDPFLFGMPPNTIPSIEPLQLFLLEAVRQAMHDAGYGNRVLDHERTAAILGIGGGGSPLAINYGFRTCFPLLDTIPDMPLSGTEIVKKAEHMLPEWTEDSFPGILFNVAVGRVANRFNFGGPNYAIDAACGSSLAALLACVRELEMGTSDLAVAMGADTVQTPYAYVAFSKTHALSPRGQSRPFDASADGIALSEGFGAVILKRLADAERDGDRIYAVIRGGGASSDGKDKGLTAPRPEGQLRALRRAYHKANISPARVGLIEAHGTGTVVGDQTEAQALTRVLQEAGAPLHSCALGSVKSMIGHSKCAAGIAGLIKTTLALHHKVLPPTLVEKPNPKAKFEESPLFLNTEARPWVHGSELPRCAGVSAFGFGGTNFHVVLEEYTGAFLQQADATLQTWPAELLVWRKPTRAALIESLEQVRQALAKGAQPVLAELAASLWKGCADDAELPTLAMVVATLDDLKDKLTPALEGLRGQKTIILDPRGIYFAEKPAQHKSRVAFLFPGQGSQYPNMLSQLALTFAEVRQVLDQAEGTLAGQYDRPLGRFIYPPSAFSPEQEQQARQELTRTEVAQPAIGAVSLGLFRLLTRLGLEPDFLAGHSYGEYVALCAAGAMNEENLIRLSYRRGQVLAEATGQMPGTMAAIEASAAAVEKALAGLTGITIANHNAPKQTVISATEEGLQAALARLKEQGIGGQKIPVSCGFHSPLVQPARAPLAKALGEVPFTAPRRTVYANITGGPYPVEPAAIATLLADHLVSPVQFLGQVEAMYQAGARIFLEVGPQAVLTGLVKQILGERPYLALACDQKSRSGLLQLQHVLGQLLISGLPVKLEHLYQERRLRLIDVTKLELETGAKKHSPSTWIVNSVRSRQLNAPEPLILGQPRAMNEAKLKATVSPVTATASAAVPVESRPAPEKTVSLAAVVSPPLPAATETNGLSHAPSLPLAVPEDEAAQVMLRFQDLMAKFLDTQRTVMLSYLQGGQGSAPAPAAYPVVQMPAGAAPSSNGLNGRIYPAAPLAAAAVPEEPAVVPAAAAPSPEATNGQAEAVPPGSNMDRNWLVGQLLDLVSKRTGYPKEMLGFDLDLEADLGIDSIKRVEILGGLAEEMGGTDSSLVSSIEMEKLTSIKTLNGIIDYLGPILEGVKEDDAKEPGSESVASSNGQPAKESEKQLEVQRALVRLIEAPLPAAKSALLPSGVVLITDDGRGIAREVISRLEDFGQKTVLVGHGTAKDNGQTDLLVANLTDAKEVNDLVERIRQQHGPIAGLVHLLPLAGPREESWPERMRREVKSLYLLARALGEEIRQCGSNGGAVMLAATGLGGHLGFGDEALADSFFPGHGGILGFSKCLAYEWPEVLVRAVDFDPARPAAELAQRLLAELSDPEGPLEVGYRGSRRVTWEPYQAPLAAAATEAQPLLGPKSVVLVTGGARGITAAIAQELAHRFQPTLILVGRSALPEESEAPETAQLTSAAEIKAALMARLQREGRPILPANVESAYGRLMQDREIRRNLASIKQAGGKVHYYQLDVRDEAALAKLLSEIEQKFGPIDGVLHGAGVIEDKLIKDKTPESFERVFGTKVDSAVTLSRYLKPAQLKFCVFFASIASRYGNRGQSDYAAANEVLSKLACYLDRQWPGRVFSVAWGPWASIGMVADLEKHLVQRGLKLIAPQEGPVFLIDELTHGAKGDTEVIIAGGGEKVAQPVKGSRRSGSKEARAEKVGV